MKTSKDLLVFSYNILGDKMEKKLPKVFANNLINKVINNETVYYGHKDKINEENRNVKKYKENIETRINKIFKSTKYVYKVDVEITTKEGASKYRIIGKNQNNLITFENKLIQISEIVDIKEL